MATSNTVRDGDSGCLNDLRSHVVAFKPSMWGDTFSSNSVDEQLQEGYIQDIETLKEEARNLLIREGSTKMEKLVLIDTLERLGVAYHLETEIEEQLELIFNHHSDSETDDLFCVALEFRLLRQHCHLISCGVFEKFKSKDNKFDEALISNVEGLLSLYEASHARIRGEEILDEAVVFVTSILNRMLPQLESPLQEKVKRALAQSLHRGVPIVEARYYISIYEKDEKRDELLVKFAKLNFNFLQNLYKKELYDVTRWWNEFNLKSKLSYVRDRLVECYFWGVAFHFEPKYSSVRSATAKSMQLGSIMDDTYDNYATFEEGQLFTEILEKWDIDAIDLLPDYMKIVYKFVLRTYEDFEREASTKENSYMIPYAKEAAKQLGRAYLKELKWFNGRQLPDFEEYFANTMITSCMYVMFIPCFIGMTSSTQETIDWFVAGPKLALAMAKMGRHVENLGSCEWENREGKMPTAVDCYMKQHGLSKQETLVKFIEQADEGWKELNTERLNVPTWIPKDVIQVFLNYARVAEITYKNCEDGYTNPEKFLASQIAAVLIDPIPL